jgi:ribosomal protein S18 acetylase RimI-like enzyme
MIAADSRVEVDSKAKVVTFHRQYRADFARLNYAWITKLFAVEPLDQRILDNPEQEIIAHGGEVFFAISGGKVVGTVALKVETATTFELTKMAVDESRRGSGYGKLLLDAAIAHAKSKAAKHIVLSSHTSLTPALTMYRQVGFVDRQNSAESCYSRCNIFMQLDL